MCCPGSPRQPRSRQCLPPDSYRRAVDLLTVHGRRADAGEAALEWANFLRDHGREDEAEPILRRAYDLGVTADSAQTTKR